MAEVEEEDRTLSVPEAAAVVPLMDALNGLNDDAGAEAELAAEKAVLAVTVGVPEVEMPPCCKPKTNQNL